MKKEYISPVVEKVTFDYKTQIVTASPSTDCFGSIVNVYVDGVCTSGTPVYVGWNSKNPGEI